MSSFNTRAKKSLKEAVRKTRKEVFFLLPLLRMVGIPGCIWDLAEN